MHATNIFEQKMLNLFRGTGITAPEKVYLALLTADPTDTGSVTSELNYPGYARQEITFSAPVLGESGEMYMENDNQIAYAEVLTSVGNALYIGLMDNMTGGDMLLYAPMANPLDITPGTAPAFQPGAIRWTWSGLFPAAIKTNVMNTLRGTNLSGITPKLAFYNGDPAASGAEFSGGGYARLSVTFSAPSQDAETGDAVISNTALTVSGSFTKNMGILSHVAIYDEATDGNLWAILPLTNAITVKKNQTIGFVAGQLKLRAN